MHYSLAERRAAHVRRAPQHPGRRDRGRQGARCCRPTRSTPGRSASTGCTSANALAAEADVVLAVGTRLQDFTTGSWTAFADDAQFIGLNAAAFDAVKHRSLPVVGDAREGLRELDDRLSATGVADDWTDALHAENVTATTTRTSTRSPTRPRAAQRTADVRAGDRRDRPSSPQPRDYAFAAAGGFPAS